MVRSWWLLSLVCVWALSGPRDVTAPAGPQVLSASWNQTGLDAWLPGTFTNTFVDGPVLRLQPDQLTGSFQSSPLKAAFGLNGAVVEVVAQVTATQTITLDLRASDDGQHWASWQSVQLVPPINDRSHSHYLPFPTDTAWLQYRVHFAATADSPKLAAITITYINTAVGPAVSDATVRKPLRGPPILTPAPAAIARADWSGSALPVVVEHQQPRRVEISEVRVPAADDSAATLRGMAWAATNLFGQQDIPFHYLIGADGQVFEGQQSAGIRLGEGSAGTIRIGLLLDAEDAGIAEPVDATLEGLLAWLGDAYLIVPASIDFAPDAPAALRDHIGEYRAGIEPRTVRWRRFFPEGSPGNGAERLVLLNDDDNEAYVTIIGYTVTGQQHRSLRVPARQRAELTLNTAFPGTAVLGLELHANHPLIAERSQLVDHELLTSSGLSTPLRTWYFAAGDTSGGTQTYLLVMNPATVASEAELTLYPDDGSPLTKTVSLPPAVRTTIHLNDLLPNRRFAFQLNAMLPVVAERSIFTAHGGASLGVGVAELGRHRLFAEGTTTGGYTTTLHILNPWPQQVAMDLQVLSEDGTTVTRRYALAAQAHLSLAINDIAPDVSLSLDVHADRPIAAERELDFGDGRATSINSGAALPETRWIFVDSAGSSDAEQSMLILNPAPVPVTLDLAFTLVDGSIRHRRRAMPASSRLTISLSTELPHQAVTVTTILADRPVVAERSLVIRDATGQGGETMQGSGGP